MDDIKTINRIFQDCNLSLWGVCPFWAVKDSFISCRAKNKIPADAVSVICVLFPYLTVEEKKRNISRYAVVPDYHLVASRMLEKAVSLLTKQYSKNTFQLFVDNSPIPEVRAAAFSGLGVIGKNGLLINPIYGSWVFIGEIVTNLSLPSTLQTVQYCLNCGRCEEACPTGALNNGRLDQKKCLSAITQQKKPLSGIEEENIIQSGCAWGCDRCQEVCPMNREAKYTNIRDFLKGKIPVADENTVQQEDRAYLWRGKQVILRNLSLLKRKEEKNDIV